jgi:hypothetical protein
MWSCVGCDPSYSVTGTVVAKGSGAPIERAHVDISCPKGVSFDAMTDDAGKFDARGRTGIIPVAGCTLTATSHDFQSSNMSVDTCFSQWSSCRRDIGRLELAPYETAPEGVFVKRVHGECSRVPCSSDECRVLCPPGNELLTVDVQEPLRGRISIEVDHVEIFSGTIPVVSPTGLTIRAQARPSRWPVPVKVRVNDLVAETQGEVSAKFLAVRSGDGGVLSFRAATSSPAYE